MKSSKMFDDALKTKEKLNLYYSEKTNLYVFPAEQMDRIKSGN
jgi:hypothetical protein